MPAAPQRGEVWTVQFGPVVGHEQGAERPAVILSTDQFNRSAADLVAVVPITRTDRRIPFHVEIAPPDGGLTTTSYALCDQIRTVARSRLSRVRGRLSTEAMAAIEGRLRILLEL
ncbi:MAG TPA: type II toxin-antitoxin system PemK/MazF family toxin [Candidatus Limnocylindria bacterium]